MIHHTSLSLRTSTLKFSITKRSTQAHHSGLVSESSSLPHWYEVPSGSLEVHRENPPSLPLSAIGTFQQRPLDSGRI